MSLFIPVLLGTGREGRQSENVAKFVYEQVKLVGIETELVDVRDHVTPSTIPTWQPGVEPSSWAKIMNRADGLIIVCPEYNHSFPGEFKIVFDSAYDEYMHKPVAFVPVSAGGFGGTRLVETLQNVVLETGMVPVTHVWNASKVKDMFDEGGRMLDEKAEGRFRKVLDELVWFANILTPAREGEE